MFLTRGTRRFLVSNAARLSDRVIYGPRLASWRYSKAGNKNNIVVGFFSESRASDKESEPRASDKESEPRASDKEDKGKGEKEEVTVTGKNKESEESKAEVGVRLPFGIPWPKEYGRACWSVLAPHPVLQKDGNPVSEHDKHEMVVTALRGTAFYIVVCATGLFVLSNYLDYVLLFFTLLVSAYTAVMATAIVSFYLYKLPKRQLWELALYSAPTVARRSWTGLTHTYLFLGRCLSEGPVIAANIKARLLIYRRVGWRQGLKETKNKAVDWVSASALHKALLSWVIYPKEFWDACVFASKVRTVRTWDGTEVFKVGDKEVTLYERREAMSTALVGGCFYAALILTANFAFPLVLEALFGLYFAHFFLHVGYKLTLFFVLAMYVILGLRYIECRYFNRGQEIPTFTSSGHFLDSHVWAARRIVDAGHVYKSNGGPKWELSGLVPKTTYLVSVFVPFLFVYTHSMLTGNKRLLPVNISCYWEEDSDRYRRIAARSQRPIFNLAETLQEAGKRARGYIDTKVTEEETEEDVVGTLAFTGRLTRKNGLSFAFVRDAAIFLGCLTASTVVLAMVNRNARWRRDQSSWVLPDSVTPVGLTVGLSLLLLLALLVFAVL